MTKLNIRVDGKEIYSKNILTNEEMKRVIEIRKEEENKRLLEAKKKADRYEIEKIRMKAINDILIDKIFQFNELIVKTNNLETIQNANDILNDLNDIVNKMIVSAKDI